ncbi:MAG: hypothetical protein R3E95_01600 [Thiolinea sp.]
MPLHLDFRLGLIIVVVAAVSAGVVERHLRKENPRAGQLCAIPLGGFQCRHRLENHAADPLCPGDYLRDYGYKGLEAPLSADDGRLHLMGTGENSGDVLSRMIHASRIALSIGFVATSIATGDPE